jgi:aldose 1-epimerase
VLKHFSVTQNVFGHLQNGEAVQAIELRNSNGMSVCIITLGASIHAVNVPDRNGDFADVTLGPTTLDEYVAKPQFFGATVGRVANRIAGARFVLDGEEYALSANDGHNALHGGDQGYDKANWVVTHVFDEDIASLTLRHISPDGDQGYPSEVTIDAVYTLNNENALSVTYTAVTDRTTYVALSNHAYWNLSGEGSCTSAMDHLLTIWADRYLPVDHELIPTGEKRLVAETNFDFRAPTRIGLRVRDAKDPQIVFGHGYDHHWVAAPTIAEDVRPLACLEDPSSGRTMTLSSNQPGLQFYSGNFLDGTTIGKSGKLYRMGDAIALEPQQCPNAVNTPEFPSVRLNPGETYVNKIVWRFETQTEGFRP